MTQSPFRHRQRGNKITLAMRGLTIVVEVNQRTQDGKPCTHVTMTTEHLDPPVWTYEIAAQDKRSILELDVVEQREEG